MSHEQVTTQILLAQMNISSESGLLLPDLHISLRNQPASHKRAANRKQRYGFFFARVSVDCPHMCNFRLQRRLVFEESSLLERDDL